MRTIAMTLQSDTLPKCPTGIRGLDDVTGGGLPRGRPTLVCGAAGCGKTLLALEFLMRGAIEFAEPGVFIAFEERPEELAANVRSLGFDLDRLVGDRRLIVDYIRLERNEIEETGEYDLEALFIRLGHAVDTIGARRVVVDTVESLFAGLTDHGILRAELRRLFRWLKDRGVTAVITGERGEGSLTRYGLEEYVSDCVILLDHRVTEQISTRRLRVVKYRGSLHGTDEYPFVIDRNGFRLLPVSSLGLDHAASAERIGTGIPRLDAMLGGAGYYRGSTVLVSGTAGTGKTSVAASFARATCHRGERCLYVAFEESPRQIVRNMASIGLDLSSLIDHGLLRIHAMRPTLLGLEQHLATLHRLVEEFEPSAVILDPISNLDAAGTLSAAGALVVRLIDLLKSRGVTALFTNLTTGGMPREATALGVSSLVDTWLLLRDLEANGERNRTLCVLKSRGMRHSNQVREFLLTDAGIELIDVYVGPEGVLTGAARAAQEAREATAAARRARELDGQRREIERRRKTLEAQVAALYARHEAETENLRRSLAEAETAEGRLRDDRIAMAERRQADAHASDNGGQKGERP
jgi:circadian clock protein KaiC